MEHGQPDRADRAQPAPLVDGLARRIRYLRLSVTDRCDLRCTYCMPERMQFLPRAEVLTLEELHALAAAFIARGVDTVRLTGGEPLVRRDVMTLVRLLGAELGKGLSELTLTTNGVQLAAFAGALADAGVRRVNVSLDTRNAAAFERLTRRNRLAQVLNGIAAARSAGLRVKINAVALRGINEDEMPELIAWAHGEGHDISLIEVMPLGEIDEDRVDHYLPLSRVRERLERRWTLVPSMHRTAGPARYFDVAETGGRLGFITPLTNNFCDGCNRVRVTATGRIYMCLGHDDHLDLRAAMRGEPGSPPLDALLDRAMKLKPARHAFAIDARGAAPATARQMSVTGG